MLFVRLRGIGINQKSPEVSFIVRKARAGPPGLAREQSAVDPFRLTDADLQALWDFHIHSINQRMESVELKIPAPTASFNHQIL